MPHASKPSSAPLKLAPRLSGPGRRCRRTSAGPRRGSKPGLTQRSPSVTPRWSAAEARKGRRAKRRHRRRSSRPGPRPRTIVRAAEADRDQALEQAEQADQRAAAPRPAPRTPARKPRGPGRTPRGSSSSCAPTRPASATSCAPRWNPAPRCSRNRAASCAPAPNAPSATSTPRGPSWPARASKRGERTLLMLGGQAPAARDRKGTRPAREGQPGRSLGATSGSRHAAHQRD